MTLRYSGVNITPDSTGKYSSSISQGGGLHYFMSWIGLRFSNRRASLSVHTLPCPTGRPIGVTDLRCLHSDGSMRQLLVRIPGYEDECSVCKIIANANVCRRLREYLGEEEWSYLPGEIYYKHDLSYLDSAEFPLDVEHLHYFPLERDVLIYKLTLKNKDLGSTTPSDGDLWTDDVAYWTIGVYVSKSNDATDKKAGNYSMHFTMAEESYNEPRTAYIEPNYVVNEGDKLHFWLKQNKKVTRFRIELWMQGGGRYEQDFMPGEENEWKEFIVDIGPGTETPGTPIGGWDPHERS